MSGKPVGSVVGLYYDAGLRQRDVQAGDVLRSPASRYRILKLRRQERGQHVGRLHLECLKIAEEDIEPDDTVHPLVWYAR